MQVREILKTLSPALEKELITKWYLPRPYLSAVGNTKGFVTIPKSPNVERAPQTTRKTGQFTNPNEKSATTKAKFSANIQTTSAQSTRQLSLLIDPSINPPIRVVNHGPFNQDYIKSCLLEAMEYRKKLGEKLDISNKAAYRLVHETGDGLPGLAIDIYANYAQIHLYSLFWKPFLRFIAETLVSDVGIKGVYVKQRIRGRPQVSRHYAGERAVDHKVVVKENNFSFLVKLTDPHSTGLFLDMRNNRKRFYDIIKKEFGKSKNFTVLNTFCHTCSFSIYAASLSASTTNIDLASEYLDWTKRNFELNKLPLGSHRFIAQDVLSAFPSSPSRLSAKESEKQPNKNSTNNPQQKPTPTLSLNSYDAVVLDPPSFLLTSSEHAHAQRTGESFTALALRAAALVREGGFLFAFANTRDVSRDTWVKSLEEAFGVESNTEPGENGTKHNETNEKAEWQKVCELEQDVDFRYKEGDLYGKYLKGLVLKRAKKPNKK